MTLKSKARSKMRRTARDKIALFKAFFTGLPRVYGTYDVATGKARQVKAPVTEKVIHGHLAGRRPYGVYLLVKDRTMAIAVDLDKDDPGPALELLYAARHYGISACIERSKSKGYHVWVFFDQPTLARKSRLVMRNILEEIGEPKAELFPRQDALEEGQYGNFINAPLFGRLVPQGRTVFLDPGNCLKPYPDQWGFLESVQRVTESTLDDIMEINSWAGAPAERTPRPEQPATPSRTFGLSPCAQRMLEEGVKEYQRVVCFRLAVAMRKAGMPLDAAIAALNVWALKNQPVEGKAILTRKEVMDQVAAAYKKPYLSCGCDDPAVKPYCSSTCPLYPKNRHAGGISHGE